MNKPNQQPVPNLETFDNQYLDRDYEIRIECPEFNSVCPKTGLPDFGTLTFTYCPNKLCVELKSLKLYLVAYRNMGIFYEHVTNKILDDFTQACKPKWAKLEAAFTPRGGIRTTVTATYNLPE
jgi:7-cyano-7-deazaguanine reductase